MKIIFFVKLSHVVITNVYLWSYAPQIHANYIYFCLNTQLVKTKCWIAAFSKKSSTVVTLSAGLIFYQSEWIGENFSRVKLRDWVVMKQELFQILFVLTQITNFYSYK